MIQGELPLHELLSEPIVRLMAQSDGVSVDELTSLCETVREKLGRVQRRASLSQRRIAQAGRSRGSSLRSLGRGGCTFVAIAGVPPRLSTSDRIPSASYPRSAMRTFGSGAISSMSAR